MTRGDGFVEKEKNTRMAEYGRRRTYCIENMKKMEMKLAGHILEHLVQ